MGEEMDFTMRYGMGFIIQCNRSSNGRRTSIARTARKELGWVGLGGMLGNRGCGGSHCTPLLYMTSLLQSDPNFCNRSAEYHSNELIAYPENPKTAANAKPAHGFRIGSYLDQNLMCSSLRSPMDAILASHLHTCDRNRRRGPFVGLAVPKS